MRAGIERVARQRNRTASPPPTGRCCSPSWPTSSLTADPDDQRVLLADRGEDLRTEVVASALGKLASQDNQQAIAAQRAAALLDLARTGHAEAVFDALAEPGQFPRLLHTLAMDSSTDSVRPAALVAYTAASSAAETATAIFYLRTRDPLRDPPHKMTTT
jgi:hypothetical protein